MFQLIRSVFTVISPTLTPRGTATNTAPATAQAKSSRKAAVRRVSRGCRRASAAGGRNDEEAMEQRAQRSVKQAHALQLPKEERGVSGGNKTNGVRKQSRSLPDSGMRVRYPLGGGGSAAGRAQGMRQRCAAHHALVLQAARKATSQLNAQM